MRSSTPSSRQATPGECRSFEGVPSDSIDTYPLGEHLVLFSQATKQLSVLNATAAAYWFALQDGQSTESFINALRRESTQCVPDSLRDDLNALSKLWQADGLLAGAHTAASEAQSTAAGFVGTEVLTALDSSLSQPAHSYPTTPPSPITPPSPSNPSSAITPSPADTSAGKFHTDVSLLDAQIRVSTDCEEVHQVAGDLFAHLEPTSNEAHASVRHKAQFIVQPCPGGWSMGLRDEQRVVATALAPLMHGQLLLHAYRNTRSFAGFHAGAVSVGADCVILPGESGSGKSSLTAALMQAGFGYCTDELAVIDEADLQLLPCPINIGLKEGVWSALDALVPDLSQRPIWHRDDGQRVRYLPPSPTALQRSHQRKRVAAFVFPRYTARGSAELVPLAPGDTLSRLTAAGYHLDQAISTGWVARIVAWLPNVPSYTLTYSNTADAVEAINLVMSSTTTT